MLRLPLIVPVPRTDFSACSLRALRFFWFFQSPHCRCWTCIIWVKIPFCSWNCWTKLCETTLSALTRPSMQQILLLKLISFPCLNIRKFWSYYWNIVCRTVLCFPLLSHLKKAEIISQKLWRKLRYYQQQKKTEALEFHTAHPCLKLPKKLLTFRIF